MDNRKWESGASANPPAAPAAPSSGHPTDGEPLASVPPTIPGAYWFYQLGEELRAILTAAGITPDKSSLTQLLTALRSAGVFATPAQFDSTTKAATTDFVKRQGIQVADVKTLGGSTVLDATYFGCDVVVGSASPVTITLPSVAAGIKGARISFIATDNGAVTISRAGTDLIIKGVGSVASLVLNAGDTLTLDCYIPGYWVAIGGTAQLGYSAAFGSSLAAAGYQKLPSGLIIQWGAGTITAGTNAVATFPIAFPSACVRALPVVTNSGATATLFMDVIAVSTTQLTTNVNTGGPWNYGYFAIGY